LTERSRKRPLDTVIKLITGTEADAYLHTQIQAGRSSREIAQQLDNNCTYAAILHRIKGLGYTWDGERWIQAKVAA